MNGEIPSVPITTLAGISSLTDLLPEMPLPSPLPQTLSNKSLLFHPRVAEEAQILLSLRDDTLVPQLIQSLVQTSADHIELKDHYAGAETPLEQQQNIPELLKAILQRNPNVFKGTQANSPRQPQWSAHATTFNPTFSQASPASYGQPSPSTSGYASFPSDPSPSGSRHTPQGSPAPPAAARFPAPTDIQNSPAHYLPTGQQSPYTNSSINVVNPASLAPPIAGAHPSAKYGASFGGPSSSHSSQQQHPHNFHTSGVGVIQAAACAFAPAPNPVCPSGISPGGANVMMQQQQQQQQQQHHQQHPQQLQPQQHQLQHHQVHQQPVPSRPKCPPDTPNSPMRMSVITEQPRTLLEHNLVKNGNDTGVIYNNSHVSSQLTRVANNNSVNSGSSSSMNAGHSNAQFEQCIGKLENKVESVDTVPIINSSGSAPAVTALAGPNVVNSPSVNNKSTTAAATAATHLASPTLSSSGSSGGSQGSQTQSPGTSSVVSSPVKKDKVDLKQLATMKLKEPRVMLNRLKPEDEALMQKSLREFAEKSPNLASKLGLGPADNHRSGRAAAARKYRDESSSESDDEPKRRSKFFKSKGKEKEIQRKKEKEERKSRPAEDEDDDDYVPEVDSTEHGSLRTRKRQRSVGAEGHSNSEEFIFKKKSRKLEKKLVPVIQKLSTEELMETNTYQRFNRSVELIFDNTEDLDFAAELDEDTDVPQEALISKFQLQDLCSEAAKLKGLGATESIPPERLVRLLNILEKNIRDGAKVSPIADPDDGEEESKLWLELTMERVMRAVDSSLVALYILTSANMPKRVYLEDVIDRIVLFTKYQLQNTIYPSFDPVYRIDSKSKEKYINIGGSARKKRAHSKEVREKSILMLYNKLNEVVNLISELLTIQKLTDTAVLHVSTLGVAPFFVESVSELQLSALKLVTTIFTRYEKHRRLLLDDILASIARLPSTKRSLRSYRLSSEENIQMLTALVLQLIQCVVALPERLHQMVGDVAASANQSNDNANEKEKRPNVDKDVLIVSKYETAMQLAGNFLTVFLNKCGSKNEEIDYRPLFENFVQDLLTTVNKPEWPSAELLLSLLGKILVKNFVNKGTEMSLRVASLDYLGVVAARLRKDAITSQLKVDTIDQIIKEIQEEEQREAEEAGQQIDSKKKKKEKINMSAMEEEEERTQFLQRVLLDYLAVTGQGDQSYSYARHFYIVQWYRDAANEVSRPAKDARRNAHKSHKKKRSKRRKKGSETEDETSEEEEVEEDEGTKKPQEDPVNNEVFRLVDKRKNFLMSKVKAIDDSSTGRTQILQTYVEYESAELISRYLASKRPFSHSFDVYLIQILSVLNENSIAIRTKAMKCLTMVVEADPAVLGRIDMQLGVRHSFLDHSTSVREAAVDLVGKFVLSRPDLIDKYYEMLSQRILDTGVSVRKRVIKILKDICIECPEFTKIPEICVKMIRRVNDEEGIRKLVMEVFQNMWFTPVRERPTLDKPALLRKVMNITDVVAKCRDIGLDWFEQLLVSLFKPKEDKDDSTKVQVAPPKSLVTSCKQIVDCLIENVLRLEETCFTGMLDTSGSSGQSDNSDEPRNSSSQRLVACLTTLYLLAKIRPQLLVDHATTLQPYLSLKCKTQGDFQIISCVARTLELVVPLIEHPSESFMAQLEEDSVKLILQHERSVVASCLSCLGSVVNNVTRNFKLIRDCFKNYYGTLTSYKLLHQKDPNDPRLNQYRAYFRRALFTVGLLMRHFDFNSKEVCAGLPPDIKNQVFETLMYFVRQPSDDVQYYTLQAIGSLCIRHYDFMLGPELKSLYHMFLTDENAKVPMRTQVLNNIEIYLQEEELRMIKQDQEWAKLSKKENLKEMGDISSGMASTVIQLYLREVMEAYLYPNVTVRKAALRVIQLILQQGLVHPVQIVPYLICMSTDVEQCVSHSADKQLQEIEKKYPGFIHMKTQDGIWLSYKLQHILQDSDIVRGYRVKEGEMPTALNGFLYSILRNTKQQRRAITLSILKQFDEQVKTSLSQMMYLADNLAYFPYQVQDEPLFIIHHIDIVLSMCGTNLLQSFREALQLPGIQQENPDEEGGTTIIYDEEEEEEDVDMLVSRIPEDTLPLQECITASQGCMLLLVLKQHLKDLYGISDAKLTQYSPSESAKVYEKALNRRSNSFFDPKGTVQKLKEGAFPHTLDEAAKRDIITQYLNFKQLMLNFDPKDPDEEEEGGNAASQTPQKVPERVQPFRSNISTTPVTSDAGTSNQTSVEQKEEAPPPKIPKLTIVPPRPPADAKHQHKSHKSHKSERHRKHKHKKKRRRYVVVDDDEDGEPSDYSDRDPDFHV